MNDDVAGTGWDVVLSIVIGAVNVICMAAYAFYLLVAIHREVASKLKCCKRGVAGDEEDANE